MLTVVADRFFGHDVSRREWIGVALAALGLAFLAATLDGGGDEAHSSYEGATLAIFVGAVILAGIAVAVGGSSGPRAGVLFGASAGLLWAASDTTIKALSDSLGEESVVGILINPMALADPAALARRACSSRPRASRSAPPSPSSRSRASPPTRPRSRPARSSSPSPCPTTRWP